MSAVATTSTPVRAPRPKRVIKLVGSSGENLRPVARIYAALAHRLSLQLPPGETQESLGESQAAVTPAVMRWLNGMDARFEAHQLRELFQATGLATEENLRALVQRILTKPQKSAADRDKVDFLLVQYLFCCAPESLISRVPSRADLAGVLQPVLSNVSGELPAWLAPLDGVLKGVESCASLGCLIRQGSIEQGRKIKESAAEHFFDPAALVAFAHFNFRLRRLFFQFVQAEVQAVRNALRELERRNIAWVDCRTANLSAEEPVSEIRRICEQWQKPFRAPYSAGRPFGQILAIRASIEKTLEGLNRPAPGVLAVAPAEPVIVLQGAVDLPADEGHNPATSLQTKAPFVSPVRERPFTEEDFAAVPMSEPAPSQPALSIPPAAEEDELTACVTKIAQQLHASRTGLDGSTASVVYKGVRLFLHSWEGAAFQRNAGTGSEALRQAVAARAILTAAVENSGRSGDSAGLDVAIALADRHAALLQEEAARARGEKQIETAVNLSASSKRLLACVGKARKPHASPAGRSGRR